MFESPRVSVIIPTFNRARCVGEAIESVLSQSFHDFELIVVDDGSTDDTPAVLARFGTRVRVLRQPNRGVSAARNTGVLAAQGEWVAFLDSDDLWVPGKLEVQLEDIARHPRVVAHVVDCEFVGYANSPISLFELRGKSKEFAQDPLRPRPLVDVLCAVFATPCWLIRRSVLSQTPGFREDLNMGEDLELLCRVALTGPFVVNGFKGTRVRRVVGAQAGLGDFDARARLQWAQDWCRILEGLYHKPELTAIERRTIKRDLSGARFDYGIALRKAGRSRESRAAVWQSFRDTPRCASFARTVLTLLLGPQRVEMMRGFREKSSGEFTRSDFDRVRCGLDRSGSRPSADIKRAIP